jgi:predicted phage tail protein
MNKPLYPMAHIKGSGGGGAPASPTRTPDTLRSKDEVEIVLGISEGEIYGLVGDSMIEKGKNFYVGDTPLVSPDGNKNFGEFELFEYTGDGVNETLQLTKGGATISHDVNVQLEQNVAVVRQGTQTAEVFDVVSLPPAGVFTGSVYRVTTDGLSEGFWTWTGTDWRRVNDPYVHFLEVRMLITQLYKEDDDGIFEYNIEWQIEYKRSNEPDTAYRAAYPSATVRIHGKTTSNYVKEFRWGVPQSTVPYTIRITQLTKPRDQEDDGSKIAESTWESFQEVNAESLIMPDLAFIHLVGQASDQFSSLPEFSGVFRGRTVRVPSNYNPTTRVYTGVWDGTFVVAYTNNPAWCLYDFVTHDRYGLSAFTPMELDKYDVYEAAKWCDVMVPDGKGGTHARWTFNHLIAEARSGPEMARFMAGMFNAAFFDDGNGKAYLRVDKDDEASVLFGPENVVDGIFDYSFSDITTRYNQIAVAFDNPILQWAQDRRQVHSPAHIDKFGIIPFDFIAVGCTNAQEALRRAQYKLLTSTTEVMSVTFQTNRMGGFVNPFDVILLSDPDLGFGVTRRLVTIDESRTQVTLRDAFYLENGINYKAKFQIPNPAYPENDSNEFILIERNIVSGNGYASTLTFTQALPSGIPEYAIFSIEQQSGGIGLPKPFRVLKVEEVDGEVDIIRIMAVELNRNKWYDVDNVIESGVPRYSALQVAVSKTPTNFQAIVRGRTQTGEPRVDILLSWDRIASAIIHRYELHYSVNGGPLQLYQSNGETFAELLNVDLAIYQFYLYSVNMNGNRSPPANVTVNLREGTISNPDGIDPVINLQPLGGSWLGQNLTIEWEAPSLPSFFKHYKVEIKDVDTGDILRTVTTTDTSLTYLYVDNAVDHGGIATRSVLVSVYVVSNTFDSEEIDEISAATTALMQNAPPGQASGVLIQWSPEGMVIGFNDPNDLDYIGTLIWVDTAPGVWQSDDPVTMQASANPIIVPELERTQPYYVHIAHYDNFGQVGLVYSNEIFVNNNIPSVPSGLALSVTKTRVGNESSKTFVHAEWDDNASLENVSHYILALRPNESSNFVEYLTPVAAFDATFYFDSYDNVYEAKVRAVNRAGISSAFSNVVEPGIVIEDTDPPAEPTGFIVDGSYNFLILQWVNDTVSDLHHTEVYMSSTTTRPVDPIDTIVGNTYFINDVAAGTVWYFWLRAKDFSGNFSDFVGPISSEALAVPDADTVPGPPGQVAGLVLTSSITIQTDGSVNSRLRATWTARTEADLIFYEWAIKEGAGGNYVQGLTGTNSYEWTAKPNKVYYVKVRAIDAANNKGTYSTEVSHTTAADATAPGVPTGLTAQTGYNSVFLRWTNPTDMDLSHVEVHENSVNNSATATKIADISGNSYIREGLATAVTRYYWIRSVDTSGNISAFNAVSGVSAVTAALGTTNIGTGSITTNHITVNTLNGDRIQTDTLDANRVKAGTVLSDTVIVGTAGPALSAVIIGAALGAIDPVTRINAGVTVIDPGKILIASSTTLADWRNGADLTKIEGGSIAANTVSANVVQIGLRGVNITGIEFEANQPTSNVVRWTAGNVIYIDDAGAVASVAITSGSSAWSSGTTMYLYWVKGATTISTTTVANTAYATNTIVLATYKGSLDLVVTYGRTIIDGSKITTNSITASQLSTGEIITVSAQIKDAIITSAKISELVADKITSGTIGAQTINIGDGRFQLIGGTLTDQQKMVVKDAGDVARVEIGKLGASGLDYGIIIRDPLGNTVLSGAGVPSTAVTGLGALATLNNVGTANIVTGFGINQLFNSTFRLSTYGWLVGANTSGQAATLGKNITVRYSLVAGSTAYVSVPNSPELGTDLYVDNDHAGLRYPVIYGSKYETYAYVGAYAANIVVGLRFYDVNGNPLIEYYSDTHADANLNVRNKHKINPGVENIIPAISVAEKSTSPVTLQLQPSAGSFAATAITGVTVGGSGSNRTLTGRASLINDLIAQGKLGFTPVNTDDVVVTATLTYGVDDPANEIRTVTFTVTGDTEERLDLRELANYGIIGTINLAPANASSVKPFVRVLYRGQPNPIGFWTKAYFGEALPNQTQTSQWTPGPELDLITPSNISTYMAAAAISEAYIADASISNAKIGNLDAGKITTGTLNADRISAESITTNKITIGGVTTDRIAAAAVTEAASFFSTTEVTIGSLNNFGTVSVTLASCTMNSIGAVMNFSIYAEARTGVSAPTEKGGAIQWNELTFSLYRDATLLNSWKVSEGIDQYYPYSWMFSEYAPVGTVIYTLVATFYASRASKPVKVRNRMLQVMEFRR